MIASNDKKPTLALDKKTSTNESSSTNAAPLAPQDRKNAAEEFREAIKVLDVERTELVKQALENIKPGRPFDTSVVREINKIETRKNRLIVARLTALLKRNGPDVQAIVHQIIEL